MYMPSQLIDSYTVRNQMYTALAGIKLLLGTPPPDKVIVTPPMFAPDIDPKSYFSPVWVTFTRLLLSLSHDMILKDM